uniref:Septin-9-like n=1 Tax=Gouania willdenowi TaxID=441366 RepID=A0A8C5GQE0_GOUWI
TSAHPSSLSRRTTVPLRTSTSSTSSQRSYDLSSRNSDYSSRSPSESSNPRSPKTGMRRIELSGGRNPDSASSRRTEMSIEVSSKQIDNSPSAGIARFGLRRPEVSLSNRSTPPERPQGPKPRGCHCPPHTHPKSPQGAKDPAHHATDSNPQAPQPPTPPPPPSPPRPAPRGEGPESPPPETPAEDSAMSEAVMVPDAVVSTAVGGLYGEKTGGGPVVDFSYVGIDAILEQMRRKAMKQGFELNIMVVGQSGLGKSTLMNTLFKSKVSRKSVLATAQEKIPKTIEIKSISHDIEEKGVRMKLTVIDTPGFGDQINNENCWQPIMKFINDQYEAYLQEEININRKKRIPDSRVHCCIYFIPPTGHCLRPLDVEFMRRLSKVVNIVPVIAKADTLTLEERDFFKKKIREELRANGIDVYPQKEFDEDADDRMINEKIREMNPFAVVGSDQEYQVNGRRLLGRKTKWGTIEVENIAHCEFAYLRDLLIRTHMQNIKDITSSIHYEMYRVRRLNENNTMVAHTNGLPEHHLTVHEM